MSADSRKGVARVMRGKDRIMAVKCEKCGWLVGSVGESLCETCWIEKRKADRRAKHPDAVKYYTRPNEESSPSRILSRFIGRVNRDGAWWDVWNPVGLTMSVWYRLECKGRRTRFSYAPQGLKVDSYE